jgi:hypothetical protein
MDKWSETTKIEAYHHFIIFNPVLEFEFNWK